MSYVVGSYVFTENPDGTVTITDPLDGSLYIATAYAGSTYYTTVYGGTAISTTANQNKALEIASDAIDELTQNRIEDVGFTNLVDRQKAVIQKVCCLIADDLYTDGFLTPGTQVSGGYSIGNLTVQAPKKQVTAAGVVIGQRALALLRSTGLMYSGVV